jgi:heme iron utilization protein
MTEENVENPTESTPAGSARTLIRRALKGALATLDRETGHPYASLVTLATGSDGSPLFLISRLALHTQNLASDQRASVLIDATGADGDPLAGGRVTVIGRAKVVDGADTKARFLARHPAASMYAGFADFAFYHLVVERAHFIGGFGRIVGLDADQVLISLADADDLVAAEGDIVSHMNEDHAGAIELYATKLAGAPGGPWRMTGIDPEGCDLVCGADTVRLTFAAPLNSPGDARRELARLAAAARDATASRL